MCRRSSSSVLGSWLCSIPAGARARAAGRRPMITETLHVLAVYAWQQQRRRCLL